MNAPCVHPVGEHSELTLWCRRPVSGGSLADRTPRRIAPWAMQPVWPRSRKPWCFHCPPAHLLHLLRQGGGRIFAVKAEFRQGAPGARLYSRAVPGARGGPGIPRTGRKHTPWGEQTQAETSGNKQIRADFTKIGQNTPWSPAAQRGTPPRATPRRLGGAAAALPAPQSAMRARELVSNTHDIP